MAKQNKFTLSVLERLEQEEKRARERKSETPAEGAPQTTEEPTKEEKAKTETIPSSVKEEKSPQTTPQVVKSTPKKEEPVAKAPVRSQEEAQEIPDLSQFINVTPERVAKNKTFYLDQEVIDGVRAAAKAQKMTDSRLVNEILRGVLGIS